MHNHPSQFTPSTAPRAITTVSLSPQVSVPLTDILLVFKAAAYPAETSEADWDRYWDIIDRFRAAAPAFAGYPPLTAEEQAVTTAVLGFAPVEVAR